MPTPTRNLLILCALFTVALTSCRGSHPSDRIPPRWGRSDAFLEPLMFEVAAPGRQVRAALEQVYRELKLEVRWSNATDADGQYIVRSARQKLKVEFQAVKPHRSMVRIHRVRDDEALANLLRDSIFDALASPDPQPAEAAVVPGSETD